MTIPRPTVDLRAPPEDFDETVEWLEGWGYGLVLLEEYALSDVTAAVRAVERAVRGHRAQWDPRIRAVRPGDEASDRAVRVVLSDHEWFEISLEQLSWFLRVVEKEDHGGHRQALGQFARVLAEALRRHRRDERRWEEVNRSESRGPRP